jgi:hypothetical protein
LCNHFAPVKFEHFSLAVAFSHPMERTPAESILFDVDLSKFFGSEGSEKKMKRRNFVDTKSRASSSSSINRAGIFVDKVDTFSVMTSVGNVVDCTIANPNETSSGFSRYSNSSLRRPPAKPVNSTNVNHKSDFVSSMQSMMCAYHTPRDFSEEVEFLDVVIEKSDDSPSGALSPPVVSNSNSWKLMTPMIDDCGDVGLCDDQETKVSLKHSTSDNMKSTAYSTPIMAFKV